MATLPLTPYKILEIIDNFDRLEYLLKYSELHEEVILIKNLKTYIINKIKKRK